MGEDYSISPKFYLCCFRLRKEMEPDFPKLKEDSPTPLPGWKSLLPGATTPLQVETCPYSLFHLTGPPVHSYRRTVCGKYLVCWLPGTRQAAVEFPESETTPAFWSTCSSSPELYGNSGHRPEPSQKETKGTFNSWLKVGTLHPATHRWGWGEKQEAPSVPFFFFKLTTKKLRTDLWLWGQRERVGRIERVAL